jgi:hypothetical protein
LEVEKNPKRQIPSAKQIELILKFPKGAITGTRLSIELFWRWEFWRLGFRRGTRGKIQFPVG